MTKQIKEHFKFIQYGSTDTSTFETVLSPLDASSLRSLISRLQVLEKTIQETGYEGDVLIDFDCDEYYDSKRVTFEVNWKRPQTEAEAAAEQAALQARAEADREARRIEYLTLKREFEG